MRAGWNEGVVDKRLNDVASRKLSVGQRRNPRLLEVHDGRGRESTLHNVLALELISDRLSQIGKK